MIILTIVTEVQSLLTPPSQYRYQPGT